MALDIFSKYATDEGLESVKDAHGFFLNTRTKLENLESIKIKIYNSVRGKIEGDSVVSTFEVHINMS